MKRREKTGISSREKGRGIFERKFFEKGIPVQMSLSF